VAILLAGIGNILASSNLSELVNLRFDKGVGYAFIIMIMWGIMFLLFKILSFVSYIGVVNMLKWMTVILILLIVLVSRKELTISVSSLKYIVVMGVLDTIAILSVVYGLANGYASVVSPVSAMYPAVTAVLAYIFYKERISKSQIFGGVLIILSVAVLSFYS
jgi:drug/metabolite transporter (DMT)-like permease